MTAETAVWVFGTGMVLFLLLFVSVTAYFLREWKKLDTILETFLNGKFDDADGRELCETRESRVISQLMRILNDARFREKRAVEEKDQVTELISDLSHQLKTPLANIVMNMELLQNDALTGAQRKEFLAHTENQARKMKWLMNSLLKASRLENGISMPSRGTLWRRYVPHSRESLFPPASYCPGIPPPLSGGFPKVFL